VLVDVEVQRRLAANATRLANLAARAALMLATVAPSVCRLQALSTSPVDVFDQTP
jgi:hypothetical protein